MKLVPSPTFYFMAHFGDSGELGIRNATEYSTRRRREEAEEVPLATADEIENDVGGFKDGYADCFVFLC